MDTKVIIVIKLVPHQGKEKELEKLLADITIPSRKEDGCIRFDPIKINGKDNEFWLLEEW
ncbi:MAG: antibiotic biosynthesis monooxygenase [Ignavibacteria bacterium]|nr:antibiotic biosynthesis monooxygenase [Ignavibacteria bacterium]